MVVVVGRKPVSGRGLPANRENNRKQSQWSSDLGENDAAFQMDGRQIPCAAEQVEKTQKQGTATGRTGSGMKIGEWGN